MEFSDEPGSVTANIYVHPWADEEEEAEGGGQTYVETVTIRSTTFSEESTPQLGSSPRSLPIGPEGTFVEGFRPIFPASASTGGSLLTAAMRHHRQQQDQLHSQTTARPNRVVALRPLEDTHTPHTQTAPLFIDVTDRGERPLTPHQTVWSGSPAEPHSSREGRVHGVGSAHWLIEEELSQHPQHPQPPVGEKKTPTWLALSFSSNSLAAGLLTIPAVFFHLGFLLGLLLLVVLSASSYFSTMAIARYTYNHPTPFRTYGAVAEATSGPALRVCLSMATVVSCMTLACIYLAALADSLVDPEDGIFTVVFGKDAGCRWYLSPLAIDVAAALVVFPMLGHPGWVRYGTYSLFIAILGTIFLFALLATAAVAVALNRAVEPAVLPCRGDYRLDQLLDVLMAMPYALSAFLSQQAVAPLMERWKRVALPSPTATSPERSLNGMNRMVNWSVTGTFIAYSVAAVAGCTIMDGESLINRFSLMSSFSIDNMAEQLGGEGRAVVANFVLRGTYSLLVLASLPLVMWPMEDHLQEGLDVLFGWLPGSQGAMLSDVAESQHHLMPCLSEIGDISLTVDPYPLLTEGESAGVAHKVPATLMGVPCARLAAVAMLLGSTVGMRALRISAVNPSTQGSAIFVLLSVVCAVTVSFVFPAMVVLQKRHRADRAFGRHSASQGSMEEAARHPGSSGHSSDNLAGLSLSFGLARPLRSGLPGGRSNLAPAWAADAEWAWAPRGGSRSFGELGSAVHSLQSGRLLCWSRIRCTALLLLVLAAFFLAIAIANCVLEFYHPDIAAFDPAYAFRKHCQQP